MSAGKGKPGIAIVLGGGPGKAEHDEPDEDDDVLDVGDDEVEAMKAFDDATTPEEKAKAMKAFIKLCGGY